MSNKKFTKEGFSQALPSIGLAALAVVFAAIAFVAYFDSDVSALIFALVIIAAAWIATFIFFALKPIKEFIEGLKNNGELPLHAVIVSVATLVVELAAVIIAVILLILLSI